MTESLDRRDLLAWAALAALGAVSEVRADESAKPALERVERQAPLGRTLDSKEPRLTDFDNKVVVVSFWASWCAPCRAEFPYLEGLQTAAGDKLQVVSVNIEDRKTFVRISRVLRAELRLLMTYDAEGACAKAFKAPGSLPYTVVLRRDRTVAGIKTGWGDQSLQELLDLVNGAVASPT